MSQCPNCKKEIGYVEIDGTKVFIAKSLTKEDILYAFDESDENFEDVKKIVEKMTDEEMEYLAFKMCDCDHFSEDLRMHFLHLWEL